jgi:hypothetical protein
VKRRVRYALVSGVALALLAGGAYAGCEGRRGDRAIAAAGGEALSIPGMGSVPYYLQNDPLWADSRLGGSGETMAAAGCTVSCVAMGLSALGYPMTPGEVLADLKRHGGFTDSGLIVWSAVEKLTDGAVRIEIPPLSHGTLDAELSAGRPVIAKIMLSESVPHWVLIVGKDGHEYLAMDPLDRRRALVRLSARSRSIHAIRVFRED